MFFVYMKYLKQELIHIRLNVMTSNVIFSSESPIKKLLLKIASKCYISFCLLTIKYFWKTLKSWSKLDFPLDKTKL